MGTSRTVSSASSRSRLGHNFLIGDDRQALSHSSISSRSCRFVDALPL
jgi:hypothetical protein